jgi:glycogen debranching enzyme
LHRGSFAFRPSKTGEPLDLAGYAAEIVTTPAVTTIRYRCADAFVDVSFVCREDARAICIFVEADVDEPGHLVFSFLPRLQPQWPAALGGVAAAFHPELPGFVLSEPSGRVAAALGAPGISRATEGLQYLLPDGTIRMEIPVAPRPDRVSIPIVMTLAEGAGAPGESIRQLRQLFQTLAGDTVRHTNACDERASQMVSIETPDSNLNRAFFWNALSLAKGLVDTPSTGSGLVAGYGPAGATSQRPGFAWFFTGDVGVNAIAYLGAGLSDTLAHGLRFAARYQRADGKIPHEVVLSVDYCKWFDAYPFAYIHGETTALWIHAVRQYYDYTGDSKLLGELWPNLESAYRWLAAEMEKGGGVPANASAGMGASEIGPLREHLQCDVYLAATAAVAAADIHFLAKGRNDDLASRARPVAERAAAILENKFWSDALQSCAHATTTSGGLSSERTVWPAVAVLYGLLSREKAVKTMEWIDAEPLTSSWGTRILSRDSKYFEPKGYNSGAVWPFVTGLAALADFRSGRADEGARKTLAIASLTFAEALGRTPEVMSGTRPRSLDTSVPHQLFSAMAVVAPVVDGILGYEPAAGDRTIRLRPCFPTGWPRVKARNLQFGKSRFDLVIERENGEYSTEIQWHGEPGPAPVLEPRNGKAGAVRVAGK